jgi:DNA-directed RNA polymerase specialized sigma24 family protein
VVGYTHEDIATLLGVLPGTSMAQLSRARARLRVALADFARD